MILRVLPARRSTHLLMQSAGAQTDVYDLRSKTSYVLDAFATGVLVHCDGRTTVGQALDDLAGDFPGADPTMVVSALDQLEGVGLLVAATGERHLSMA
jgi:hypothetical protein